MKIRTAILTLLLAAASAAFGAPEPPTLAQRLQQGLVEEEVNRDPKAAIEHYAKLLEDFDAGRQFAGTALFRTAECHRKLGDDKAAAESFSRLVTLFPEQEKLAELAKQNLTALGVAPPQPALDRLELTEEEIESLKELRTIARDSPDLITAKNGTHLVFSINKGHATATRFLLDSGASPDQSAMTQYTTSQGTFHGVVCALDLATAIGNHSIVQMLLDKGATITPETLDLAIRHEHSTIESTLLEAIDAEGFDFFQPLARALNHGRIDVFNTLIAHGANPKSTGDDGTTLLHVAANQDGSKLYKDLIEKHGVPVEQRNERKLAALDFAAANGQVNGVKVLLEAGADPNGISTYHAHSGATAKFREVSPLMHVLGPGYTNSKDSVKPILDQLIAAGADVNYQDANGNSPLHYAVGHAATHHADILSFRNMAATWIENPWDGAVMTLLKAGASSHLKNNLSVTPVDLARRSGLGVVVERVSLLESPDRKSTVVVSDGSATFEAAKSKGEQDAPPLLAELIATAFQRVSLPGNISVAPLDGESHSHDIMELASSGAEPLPRLAWGDHVTFRASERSGEEAERALLEYLLPQLERSVTVKRGDLEATFTITRPLPFCSSTGAIYDVSSSIVRDVISPYDLAKNAFLLTPYTTRSVAKLIRKNGETLNISLLEQATDQPELLDGDRLEIVEGEQTWQRFPAITCDERLLYWSRGIDRPCSLADLLASAYGGNTPFVISSPDLGNLTAKTITEVEGIASQSEWDIAKLIADSALPSFSRGGTILNIPLLSETDRQNPWTGLTPEVSSWLDSNLTYSVEVFALDQPARQIKIGPEIFHYAGQNGSLLRESQIQKNDDSFDVRSLEVDRMLPYAGYVDKKLYDLEGALVNEDGHPGRGQSGSIWLWDGAKIRLSAPRKNSSNPSAAAAAIIEATRRANAAKPSSGSSRSGGRRVVLPLRSR